MKYEYFRLELKILPKKFLWAGRSRRAEKVVHEGKKV